MGESRLTGVVKYAEKYLNDEGIETGHTWHQLDAESIDYLLSNDQLIKHIKKLKKLMG